MGPAQVPTTALIPTSPRYALVAAFCVFLIWWGVRQVSPRARQPRHRGLRRNRRWFYFSDLLDKMDRSLGLIGLGILFLVGGWVLEKTRRSLLARMAQSASATKEAQ